MTDYMTLKVADTRFAVKCDYAPFMTWLVEKNQGFASQEKPQMWLSVRLDVIPQARSQVLSITAKGGNNSHVDLNISVACADLTEYYWPVLHLCLRCAVTAKHPPDLLLHSSGIVSEGNAYLFSGPSGIGKSTLCGLFADDGAYTILHDDIIAISHQGGEFYAWSTPPKDDITTRHSSGAPLRAVFFLKQDITNYTTGLSRRKGAGLLATNLIPTLALENGSFIFKPEESLGLSLMLAEVIPCYELHFRPERSFWECIPSLFDKEPVITPQKG